LLILTVDNWRTWTDFHTGAVSAVSAVVSTGVGLVTFLTLRHAIRLSEDEHRRERDALQPMVTINSYYPDSGWPSQIMKLHLEFRNAGRGPALNVRMEWENAVIHYVNYGYVPITPFSLSSEESRTFLFAIQDSVPFTGPIQDQCFEPSVEMAREKFASGQIDEHELHVEILEIRNRCASQADIASNVVLEYEDIFGNPIRTIATVKAHTVQNVTYALIDSCTIVRV